MMSFDFTLVVSLVSSHSQSHVLLHDGYIPMSCAQKKKIERSSRSSNTFLSLAFSCALRHRVWESEREGDLRVRRRGRWGRRVRGWILFLFLFLRCVGGLLVRVGGVGLRGLVGSEVLGVDGGCGWV